jgi:hypothetical protein
MRGQMQTPIANNALFLTEPEAASLLRLSRRTLQRLRNRGDGPPFTRLETAVSSIQRVTCWRGPMAVELI